MYKTIVVPVQLANEEHDKELIGLARKLGGKSARIIVVHVIEEVPTYVATNLPVGLLDESTAAATQELDALAKSADAAAETDVRSGHTATTILAIAAETGADLIVVGSHRPGFQDYLLGSTAARLVRHSDCSVLVAR